jgi:hypothetical protein
MDKHDLMTVGDVAKRSGYAASAIRYYESQGLVTAHRVSLRDRFERVGADTCNQIATLTHRALNTPELVDANLVPEAARPAVRTLRTLPEPGFKRAITPPSSAPAM